MPVTDDAIAAIKGMIVSGELSPGEKLPPEREMCESLGLSRSSLREAVKALQLVRVLDVRRGDGTYVTALEPGTLLEAVSFVLDLHHDDSVLELFEVRRMLEPQATAMAAKSITEDQVAALQAMVDDVSLTTSIEDLVAHDLEFHRGIVEACENAYLSGILESVASHTVRARIWRGMTELGGHGAVERTLAEHGAILDALARGDDLLARAHSFVHVSGTERWLRRAAARAD